MPQGALLHGTSEMRMWAIPSTLFALPTEQSTRLVRSLRSAGSCSSDLRGRSNYNSMQLTLSRQTGKRLQYFASYTLGRTKGTLGDEYRERDPSTRHAHTACVRRIGHTSSMCRGTRFCPTAANGAMDNTFGRGLLNGWQLSGISTFASGIPIWFKFDGPAGDAGASRAYYGTGDTIILRDNGNQTVGGLAPVYTCNPSTGNGKQGEKMFDINCFGFPAFGENGQVLPPNDIRSPNRQNHDLTLFKNFAVRGDQKLQLRFGFFNFFNQAFASTTTAREDINLALNTECNVYRNQVPNGVGGLADNVCDLNAGFHFTQDTIKNFGNINILRGRRIIELALKYDF